jgi:hypothetical protein
MERARGGARWPTVCVSMYSITENIYYSELSSVAILLQPEPVSHRIIQGNDCFLSLCAIVFRSPPASHASTCNGQRSSQLFCVHYTGGVVFKRDVSSSPLTAMRVLRLTIRIVDLLFKLSPTIDRQQAGQGAQLETVKSLQLHR